MWKMAPLQRRRDDPNDNRDCRKLQNHRSYDLKDTEEQRSLGILKKTGKIYFPLAPEGMLSYVSGHKREPADGFSRYTGPYTQAPLELHIPSVMEFHLGKKIISLHFSSTSGIERPMFMLN